MCGSTIIGTVMEEQKGDMLYNLSKPSTFLSIKCASLANKSTAFIQRFSNLEPLKALHNNSPITLRHTDGSANHAGQQPAGQEQLGLGAWLRVTTFGLQGTGDRTRNLTVASKTT